MGLHYFLSVTKMLIYIVALLIFPVWLLYLQRTVKFNAAEGGTAGLRITNPDPVLGTKRLKYSRIRMHHNKKSDPDP